MPKAHAARRVAVGEAALVERPGRRRSARRALRPRHRAAGARAPRAPSPRRTSPPAGSPGPPWAAAERRSDEVRRARGRAASRPASSSPWRSGRAAGRSGCRAKIRSGHVSLPAPAVKFEITTSSKENVKASIPPATMAGASRGSVTWRKVASGGAPRSMLASSSVDAHGDEAGAHDQHDERRVEHRVADEHRHHAELEAEVDEEDQHGDGDHELRHHEGRGTRARRTARARAGRPASSASAAAVPNTVATSAEPTAICSERPTAEVIESSCSAAAEPLRGEAGRTRPRSCPS